MDKEMKTPYLTQQQCIDKTIEHLDNGKTKIINVQFCGLGKTELGAWISKEIKGNILFVVHKNSILNQAAKTYKELIPKRSFGFFNIDEKKTNKEVTFATIQTLSKEKNLAKFPEDYFELIIIDECHHMATKTYDRLLNHFNNRYLFGFTATPDRADNKPILDLFEEKVGFFDEDGNDKSLRMGIEMGYLSPLRYFALNDNIDYEKILHNGYRYNKKNLDKELIIKKRNDLVVKKWMDMASGKKTIAFCNSVKHAKEMELHFSKFGINAVTLSYKAGKNLQKVIEAQFRQGVFDVILTVDLYIEGVDFPSCECVMFLRPTESERIFVQQLGRVMRISEGKQYGMVMDFVGNQRNAYDRQKWIKKLLIGKEKGLNYPKDYKPIIYYDPLVEIQIDAEIVDIFKNNNVKDINECMEEIIIDYRNGMTTVKLSKKFGFDRDYIAKILQLHKEYDPPIGRAERNKIKIIDDYNNGSTQVLIAKKYKIARSVIFYKLKQWGVYNKYNNNLDENRKNIINDYENGMSTRKLSKKYSVMRQTITGRLNRWGIKIRRIKIVFDKNTKQKILNDYKNMNPYEIAKKYSYDVSTIKLRLKQWGVYKNSKQKNMQEKLIINKENIIIDYDVGMSFADIGRKYNISQNSISYNIKNWNEKSK